MQMINDIDKADVIEPGVIGSPLWGSIPVERLSRGVKTLILMNKDSKHIFNASMCGDNCAKWFLKISEKKDLVIRLGYLMDFGKEDFEIEILNLGKIVHNGLELAEAVLNNHLI